ncbi:TonB-dependent receptor [Sphingopyxis sp.]|uniref:TonB-dependent receptor n=1 Tax=Sphingopyxis sp. TaxID=1908224 RepID=UPI002FCB1D0A
MKRGFAMISVSLLALTPAVASAQDADVPADAASTAPQEGLGEIVVTAQRRSQNIQDVPISIAAISGEALTEVGIRDPRDLSILVPGLSSQAGTSATTTSLFLRGVGIGDFNSNTTGAVGVYVDDVFLGANAGKLFNVFDSDGIEVLKGPQGTLYGRNTTAGAIRFSSRKPTDEFSANAALSYGRFNEVQVEGGVGGPIVTDLLKMRVAGTYLRRDGWLLNRVTGNKLNDLDMWAGRAIVDLTPSEDVLIRAIVHGGQNRGGARQFQHRGQGVDFAGNPNFADGVPLDGLGYADTDGDLNAGDYDIEGQERVNVFGASLTASINFSGVTLTSISAYEQVRRSTVEDTDASPNNVLTATYIDRPQQYSQELRLQSRDGGAVNWIVGGYYFHDKLVTESAFDILRVFRDPNDLLGTFDPVNSIGNFAYPYTQKTESWAAFAQADVKLSDRLTLTGGLRYSADSIDFDFHSFFDDVIVVPVLDFEGSKTFKDLSWRAALSFQATDDLLFYASSSKGYNSGGFAGGSSSDLAQLQPFRSEKLYAYEAGFKSDLLGRTLRFNAAAFYYDYRDLQVFVFDTSGVLPVQRKLNAGNAELYGLEIELQAQPSRTFNAFVNASLLHARYKDFTALAADDYSGNKLVNAPEYAISAGFSLTQPLPGDSALKLRVDGSLQSETFLTPDNIRANRVKPYGIANARLSWLSADENLEVALWAKNITGTRYVTYVSPVVTMDQLNYNDPATYGVQAVLKF